MCKKKLKYREPKTTFPTKEAIPADHIAEKPKNEPSEEQESAKLAHFEDQTEEQNKFKASNFQEFYCTGNPECDACNLDETVEIMEAQCDCYNYMFDEECPECSIADCADESEN